MSSANGDERSLLCLGYLALTCNRAVVRNPSYIPASRTRMAFLQCETVNALKKTIKY